MKIFLSIVLTMSFAVEAKGALIHRTKSIGRATEFYFARHGQTDYNSGAIKRDSYPDISLNGVGRQQAALLRPAVEGLPVKTICCSPLLRARETKDIVNQRLALPVVMIDGLREGVHQDWCELQQVKNSKKIAVSKRLKAFLARLKKGLSAALEQPGPVLIVAHGGVYSGLCRLLDINPDAWAIANCTLVRFYRTAGGSWSVQHLFDVGRGRVYDRPLNVIVNECEMLR